VTVTAYVTDGRARARGCPSCRYAVRIVFRRAHLVGLAPRVETTTGVRDALRNRVAWYRPGDRVSDRLPAPDEKAEHPFRIHTAFAQSSFGRDTLLARVGIQARLPSSARSYAAPTLVHSQLATFALEKRATFVARSASSTGALVGRKQAGRQLDRGGRPQCRHPSR
jgi:hypothetical protein